MGMKPVYRIDSGHWKRIPGNLKFDYTESKNFIVTFTHTFPNSDADVTVYFAWTYPYSFTESLQKTQKWLEKAKK
jgi:hypothetical protein